MKQTSIAVCGILPSDNRTDWVFKQIMKDLGIKNITTRQQKSKTYTNFTQEIHEKVHIVLEICNRDLY